MSPVWIKTTVCIPTVKVVAPPMIALTSNYFPLTFCPYVSNHLLLTSVVFLYSSRSNKNRLLPSYLV